MNEQILFVDDDQRILDAFRRQLGERYAVHTAVGPEEGLQAISKAGPYAVVVSDMRMPGMDGIAFLKRVRSQSPCSVRVMLTGHADLATAVEAVNEGNIFRFLSKPCRPDVMSSVLDSAIEQYRLQTLERDLLEKTLRGSINVLTEILSLVNPVAFGRASRVRLGRAGERPPRASGRPARRAHRRAPSRARERAPRRGGSGRARARPRRRTHARTRLRSRRRRR